MKSTKLVWTKLQKLGLRASDLCDDATFLRRLHLDAIGTLPQPHEVQQFLADTSPNKRNAAIDRVLRRDELARLLGIEVGRHSAGEFQ